MQLKTQKDEQLCLQAQETKDEDVNLRTMLEYFLTAGKSAMRSMTNKTCAAIQAMVFETLLNPLFVLLSCIQTQEQ